MDGEVVVQAREELRRGRANADEQQRRGSEAQRRRDEAEGPAEVDGRRARAEAPEEEREAALKSELRKMNWKNE